MIYHITASWGWSRHCCDYYLRHICQEGSEAHGSESFPCKDPFWGPGRGTMCQCVFVKFTTVKYFNLILLRLCIFLLQLPPCQMMWEWSQAFFFFLEPDKGNLSWGIFSFDLTWFSVISVYSSVTAKRLSLGTASRNTPMPHSANSASCPEETASSPITICVFPLTPSTRSMWAVEEKPGLKWPFPSFLERVDALPHTESTSQVEIK